MDFAIVATVLLIVASPSLGAEGNYIVANKWSSVQWEGSTCAPLVCKKTETTTSAFEQLIS